MSQLSYITMCIKESLRLYPLAAKVGKLLSEDVVMSGQRFPKGTYLFDHSFPVLNPLKECVEYLY